MQIRIILDDSEVASMVNKMKGVSYNKKKIALAGQKIKEAYIEFEKTRQEKDEVNPNQVTIDDILGTFGGKEI